MRIQIVQYILSVLLLTCLSYKSSAPLIQFVSQEVECMEHFSSEKEAKELEKLYEVEIFFQSNLSFIFVPNTVDIDYFDKKNSLPFRHFQLHYPPPNTLS